MRDATDTVDPFDADDGPGPAAEPLRSGDVLNGRYEVRQLLGSGGWAYVYAAYDNVLEKIVALKLLRPERASAAALGRLRREALLAQRVQNEHLVRLFDIAQSESGPFITMERIEGESLRAVLGRSFLDPGRAVAIARDILAALKALHGAGIIHRDVKPGNILIDSAGTAKLTDFGLAKDFTRDDLKLTQTDAIVGTAAYLSPEQVLGHQPDVRSDLYAVGVVLYEMLSGAVPFENENLLGLMLAQLKRRAPDVRELRRDTPRWLAQVVARLLEKNPADRFQSADEVITALKSQQVPIGRRAVRLGAVALLVATITGAAVWQVRSINSGRFHSLVPFGGTSVQAIDRDGRVLWTKDGVGIQHLAPITSNGQTMIGAFLHTGNKYATAEPRSRLSFLDPESGAVIDSMVVQQPGPVFADFADEFGVGGVTAVDVDHDGNQELVATFAHVYWPSYTALIDPLRRTSRIVFYGSGHHTLATVLDVNNDGQDELIMGGINNRMGWYAAVAAVDVGRSPASTIDALSSGSASSPDAEYTTNSARSLVWYTLLPLGYPSAGMAVQLRAGEGLRVNYPDGRHFDLGLDGFLLAARSPLGTAERSRARTETYRLIREASRLDEGGAHEEAIAEVVRAAGEASRAGDHILAEWVERVRIRSLIHAGRVEEAFRVLAAFESSESFSDIAFDAAVALHLEGALSDAVRWYASGLARRPRAGAGRSKYEFLEGAVLALVEQKRFADAERVINSFCEQYTSECGPRDYYRNYVRWMAGERPAPMPMDPVIDLYRYWALEFRRANRDDSAELLADVQSELQRNGSSMALLRSLEADLLMQLDRMDEAERAADQALATVSGARARQTEARAHFALVSERARRIRAASGVSASGARERRP